LATRAVLASIAPGVQRMRQSLQDWSRVGEVTPGIQLRWLPGAKREFPYREGTLGVEFGTGESGSMGVVVGGCRGRFCATGNARWGSLSEEGNRVTLDDFGVDFLSRAIRSADRARFRRGGRAGGGGVLWRRVRGALGAVPTHDGHGPGWTELSRVEWLLSRSSRCGGNRDQFFPTHPMGSRWYCLERP
jgi:hypothetical protein